MNIYKLGLYEKAMPGSLCWYDKLTTAKNAGFDYVEMSVDETDAKLSRLDMPAKERLDLVETMFSTGIPIRTICLSAHRKYSLGSTDPAISGKGMEIMRKAIQLADDLGIRMIQVAGYDVYYEESTPATAAGFEVNIMEATRMAARSGIMLGFETMETEFMNTVEKAMKYVSLASSPYLQVYPDCGNLTNAALGYGSDILADLRCGEGHLAALHLKETLPGIYRDMAFGKGHVDFEAVISEAWSLGVRRYVTEFWYEDSENWRQDLFSTRQMITAILDKQKQNNDGAADIFSESQANR